MTTRQKEKVKEGLNNSPKSSERRRSKDFERNQQNLLLTGKPSSRKCIIQSKTMSLPSTESTAKSRLGEDLAHCDSFPGATKKMKSAPAIDICEFFHRSFDETSLSLSDIALSMELDP
jgi:hypothetical protein